MNVAVINVRDFIKYIGRIVVSIIVIFLFIKYISNSGQSIEKYPLINKNRDFFTKCISSNIIFFTKEEKKDIKPINLGDLMSLEVAVIKKEVINQDLVPKQYVEENKLTEKTIETQVQPTVEISKKAQTEVVTEKNIPESATNYYGTTKIDNESSYTITEEMLKPDEELTNKKDILIYHTHTCESYTPCEHYNYEMTGNYRTTDVNYNVVRVGNELTTYLSQKGFNVVHDGTYHDYPAYSGSYSRALKTAENLLVDTSTELVIDLHRDAIGNGDTYGPTVLIDNQRVAQLMFVIGTNGGGLEHPDWVKNLKIAVKIQEKANEMYPGLFRPIIVRNSRYNQHLAKGACIIEVGATANELEECLLSMQCLANVIDEVCK